MLSPHRASEDLCIIEVSMIKTSSRDDSLNSPMKLSQIFQIQCHFHRGRKNASSRIEFNRYRPKSLRMSIRCSRRICSPNLVRVASQDSEKIVPSLGKSRTPMMLKACSSASERTPGFFTSGISISLSERSHRE